MKLILAILVVLVISACDSSPTAVICDRSAQAGLHVDVVDSAGLAPAPFVGLQVISRGESIVDTADVFRWSTDTTLALGLWEKPGTFAVEVTAPGYITWTVDDVRVRMEDECHVATTRIIARLRK